MQNKQTKKTNTMSELNIGFGNLSDIEFLQKGREIVNALTTPPGSVYFGSVIPTTTTLAAALDAFESTLLLGNAPGAATDREAAREAADTLMGLMAAGIENITTDRTQLAHSGYDLRKPPQRDTTPTGTPQNVRVKPTGIQGEAQMAAEAVYQAKTYEARATRDLAAGPFVSCTPSTSLRGLRFEGLERGKDWFFQIRAISPNGPGPWSDPATMMVV